MGAFLIAAWNLLVKWPLSFLADVLYFGPIRQRAAAAFDRWAADAAANGVPGVAGAVSARITYLSDPLRGLADFVVAPAATWARRYGDCDDFSYLTAELLRRAGVDAWICTHWCWNFKDSHVTCLFRDGASYGTLDQSEMRGGFGSLDAAARAARPSARVAATLVQPYGRRGDVVGRWMLCVARRKKARGD